MAHPAQAEFSTGVRAYWPRAFTGAGALKAGSLDINSSVRERFTDCRPGRPRRGTTPSPTARGKHRKAP